MIGAPSSNSSVRISRKPPWAAKNRALVPVWKFRRTFGKWFIFATKLKKTSFKSMQKRPFSLNAFYYSSPYDLRTILTWPMTHLQLDLLYLIWPMTHHWHDLWLMSGLIYNSSLIYLSLVWPITIRSAHQLYRKWE